MDLDMQPSAPSASASAAIEVDVCKIDHLFSRVSRRTLFCLSFHAAPVGSGFATLVLNTCW